MAGPKHFFVKLSARFGHLLQSDRLVVDGTLVQAWASHKSFRPKEEQAPPKGGISKFKGMKRSNNTHESKTDKDAKLFRKGEGTGADLCLLLSIIVDSETGYVAAGKVTSPYGFGENAEVKAANELAEEHMREGQTLVADRGYDCQKFTRNLRELSIRPHARSKSRGSSIDGRTTCRASYRASMKVRYVIEGCFGWLKSPGRLRQTMLRGTEKVSWEFRIYCAAFNLRKFSLVG